jgi:uncharacterized protein
MNQLHPKAVTLFFLRTFLIALVAAVFVAFIYTALQSGDDWQGSTFIIVFAGTLAILSVIMYVTSRLTYVFFFYELRREGFYIESGILVKKYKVIPYGRIQNIDITKGPLTMLLGLADIQVQTAGSSDPYRRAEGQISGLLISDAENLRNELLKRAGKHAAF